MAPKPTPSNRGRSGVCDPLRPDGLENGD